MNTIRAIAIALPMTLLLACGGGGGTAATGTPRNTPGPMTPPPPITLPSVSDPQTLPEYLITDLDAARTAVGGTAPADMTYSDIIRAIRTRAEDADTLQLAKIQMSGALGARGEMITPTCTGTSCVATIPDIGEITFSLAEIYDPSLVNDGNLNGYDADVQAVMIDEGATLIQGISAARGDGGTPFTFRTYAGWFDGSVFGFGILSVTENNTTTNRLTSYSFGDASGSNPSATGSETSATWEGVVRAHSRRGSSIFDGNVTVDIDDFSSPDVDVVITPDRVEFSWNDITLNNGTFEDTNTSDGTIKGTFYGGNHEEVGGVFSTLNFYGAFGGTRQ